MVLRGKDTCAWACAWWQSLNIIYFPAQGPAWHPPLYWELQGALSQVPLCTGHTRPVLKITIIAKAVTTICWKPLIARHHARFFTCSNIRQWHCYFPHFAEENMGCMFNDELLPVKEPRSRSGSHSRHSQSTGHPGCSGDGVRPLIGSTFFPSWTPHPPTSLPLSYLCRNECMKTWPIPPAPGYNSYTSSFLDFHPTGHRKGLNPWVTLEAGSSFSPWPTWKSAELL